jgi:hypothetical protein
MRTDHFLTGAAEPGEARTPAGGDDLRDWLVIGLFAGLSALLVWIPLLMHHA